jgi:hypothetical protein
VLISVDHVAASPVDEVGNARHQARPVRAGQ